MDKFQIAKFGMMQVTAIVYGVLATGTVLKVGGHGRDALDAAAHYSVGEVYRDYGFWLLVLVPLWVWVIGYLSESPHWDIEDNDLEGSGFALAVGYAFLGTFIAFGCMIGDQHVLVWKP